MSAASSIEEAADFGEHERGLRDCQGRRLSMTLEEMRALLAAAEDAPATWRTLVRVLAFSGCRPAEARALTASDVDLSRRCLNFETLRRKEQDALRAVPVPDFVLRDLARVHHVRAAQADDGGRAVLLWPWSDVTAWNRIGRLMEIAAIEPGPHATARGIRHGFAQIALDRGVPIGLIRNWLGYAAIRAVRRAYGNEGALALKGRACTSRQQRELAARVWSALASSAVT